jgi:predicted dehydrogenase
MPLKICLIGAGHMGKIHAQKLAEMKDVTLSCIVDADSVQADEISRKHGVPGVCDHREVFNDGTRGAVIAATTESHYPLARALLENGIHVFVEKPVAATPEQARELMELAKKCSLVLQVGHLERFSPSFRNALRFIQDPHVIEAHRISSFTGRSTDIDVIHDLMIHDIDLTLSIAKGKVSRIWAQGMAVLTENIDIANARIEFDNGCRATLTASRVSNTKERLFRVIEKNGYVSLNLAAGKMFFASRDNQGKFKTSTYTAAHPDPVKNELRDFVGAIRKKREPIVDGKDGLDALVVANSIKECIEHRLAEKELTSI